MDLYGEQTRRRDRIQRMLKRIEGERERDDDDADASLEIGLGARGEQARERVHVPERDRVQGLAAEPAERGRDGEG